MMTNPNCDINFKGSVLAYFVGERLVLSSYPTFISNSKLPVLMILRSINSKKVVGALLLRVMVKNQESQ